MISEEPPLPGERLQEEVTNLGVLQETPMVVVRERKDKDNNHQEALVSVDSEVMLMQDLLPEVLAKEEEEVDQEEAVVVSSETQPRRRELPL